MVKSRDGWQWTRHEGLKPGLPCIGVINPSQNVKNFDNVFDVVVIGAGYAGLTAARDLTTAGLLLIISPSNGIILALADMYLLKVSRLYC